MTALVEKDKSPCFFRSPQWVARAAAAGEHANVRAHEGTPVHSRAHGRLASCRRQQATAEEHEHRVKNEFLPSAEFLKRAKHKEASGLAAEY
jgi:hypothetical protein